MSLLNLFTFAWLMAWAIRSFHGIAKGQKHSVNFVIIVLFIFCGVPILLDEIVGKPRYEGLPGFSVAATDEMTNIVYCLYMIVTPVLLLWIGKPAKKCSMAEKSTLSLQSNLGEQRDLSLWNRFILRALLISPVVMALLSPDPGQYLIFTDTLRFSDFYQEAHIGISLACNLAVLAGAFLIAISRPAFYGRWPNMKTMFAVVPWMFIAVWIQGKRGIAAIAALLLMLAFHCRGVLRGARAYFLVAVALGGVLGYSFFLQSYAGRVNTTWYENVRVDYGRDDKIKMTIYAELHPEVMRILEFRGQSLLFYLTAFVPREIWPNKPLPYAQYFTSALFLSEPRLWGWGMTTSWLEEAVANLGWLGMLFGPLLIGVMCRLGDASQNDLARILTPLMASLMLVVQASAFLPLLLLWLILVLQERARFIKFA